MPPTGFSAIALVGLYLCTNLLLAVAAVLVFGIRSLNHVLPRSMTYRHILATGRALAVVALAVPILAMLHGKSEVSALKAQVWAGPSMTAGVATAWDDSRIAVGTPTIQATLGVDVAEAAAVVLFGGSLLLSLVPAISQVGTTIRAVRATHTLRNMGSVRVLVSDSEPVPFALWIPGHSYIVLLSTLLLRPEDVRMALRHEGQHHRQGDTRYLYLALLARAMFGLNPAAHWLLRQLTELQELACDAAVAQRRNHCRDAYCACLMRVAETALALNQSSLRSFMTNRHADALRRRIEALVRAPRPPLRSRAAIGVSVAAGALLAALSVAIATPIDDRRISRADAEQLVVSTPDSAAWGLRVNDAVLRQLNLLLGTPEGRTFLMASIARMRNYEPGMLAELKRYGLPSELAAVPVVESGYQNHPARNGAVAGLWMFISSTAKHYGLYVSNRRDDRLNVGAETQAAMRMFSDLRNRFQDWPLALMAYNAGVSRIEAGMAATHSRDAWTVNDAGYGNDPDYLARTTAVMLVLAHPHLLD